MIYTSHPVLHATDKGESHHLGTICEVAEKAVLRIPSKRNLYYPLVSQSLHDKAGH